SGVGKTTIGETLAGELGWRYIDADDYHPAANVAKMAAGTPLQDEDRWPWLDKLNSVLQKKTDAGPGCPALKERYLQPPAPGRTAASSISTATSSCCATARKAASTATCRRPCCGASSTRSSRRAAR